MKRLLLALALLFPVTLYAGNITATWIAPTACSDGSPITSCAITKYTLYSGLQGATKTVLATTAPGVTTFTATNTPPGTWCLQVSASSAGGESGLSTEGCKTILVPAPASPSGLALTVGSNTTAFTLVKKPDGLLALAVGSVPPGTACIPDEGMISHGVTYFVVPRAQVKFSGTIQPVVTFAACG